MKGEFFRPCPKCGKICNAELDMCEICSGKIAKPEQPKPVAPVVAPVVEKTAPIVEEITPIVEETVVAEEIVEEVATEENVMEEITNEENQEAAPVTKTKAPKGKGTKGLYALVAVLMLVIVALVVVIMQDKQPEIAVNNTTLQSDTTTSTTLKQETEPTTEITEGTTVDNAGETLAPVTTTKKAQNSSKETTTKKITTTTTEANKVDFNPEIVYSKDKVYRDHAKGVTYEKERVDYYYNFKIKNVYIERDEAMIGSDGTTQGLWVECEVVGLYEYSSENGWKEVAQFDKLLSNEEFACNYAVGCACYAANGRSICGTSSFTDEIYTKETFRKGTRFLSMLAIQSYECEEGYSIADIAKIKIEGDDNFWT